MVGIGSVGPTASDVVEVIDLGYTGGFSNCTQPPSVEGATYGHPGAFFDGRPMLAFDPEGRVYREYLWETQS